MMNSTESVPRKTGMYLALALVAAWIGYLVYAVPRMSVEMPGMALEPPRHNPNVDYSWELTDLEGQPVEFAKYKDRALFLNFWATWCGPCKAEMPSIVSLSKREAVKNVDFVLVANDDERGAVRRYLEAHPELKAAGIDYLICREPPLQFQTEYIPATFLVTPKGRIVGVKTGSTEWDSEENVKLLADLATER